MADAPWRKRRRCLAPLSASLLLALLLALLSPGCLSEQYSGNGVSSSSSEQLKLQHQQNTEQQQQQHKHHHHIFNSNHTAPSRKNRHPRVPPRRDACDPHSVPPQRRCAYVTEQRSCEAAGGRVPYTRLWFCLVFGDDEDEGEGGEEAAPPPLLPLPAAGGNSSSSFSPPPPPPPHFFSLPAAALLLLGALLWATALLSLLAAVSSNFLAPAVQWVATSLKVPPALAGVTLLALAGGAPDLATEIAAVLSRDYGGFSSGSSSSSSEAFEMVFEDGTPAPPMTPAERAVFLKEATAIVADDLGMGVAVALGSSLATLCCGLAAIGWFARSRRSNNGRKSWRRRKHEGDAAADATENDASAVSHSSSSSSPGITIEDPRAFARDVSAYTLAVVALGAALFDGALGLFESLGLLAGYLVYVAASVLGSRASERKERERDEREEARREEEERAEAAEEGGGGGGSGFELGAKETSPSSIEMTSSSTSASVLLRQQLPPRSPVRSPSRSGGQQQGSNSRNGTSSSSSFAVAAFPSGGAATRAVAAPRRRASTEVGDALGRNSNPNPNSNLRVVVAPPPTPSGGGFFGATLLRSLLVGGGGTGTAGRAGGADNDPEEEEEARTPLLLPLPLQPPPSELASAFSEPLSDSSGVPFSFPVLQHSQQQQQRSRSRSPVGRLSSQLTRLPRRLSSAGGEAAAPAAAAAATTTTSFSLSPNGAAAAPLALKMTAASAASTAENENNAEATRPRARKGTAASAAAAAPLSPPSSARRLAAAARAAADDLFPARIPAPIRLLLAALVAPVAAALHCTMPAFGEEEEEEEGRGGGAAVETTPTAAKEASAAAVSAPPPPPSRGTPLLSLPRAVILCACAPLAAASLLGATPTVAGGSLRFALSALGGTAALAVAFAPYFWKSRGKPVPLRCAASAALALALSGAWLAAAADEAVDLARALARAARLPSELAGGLLLGAGEALPDVAATAALARAAARRASIAAAAAVAAAATAAAAASSSSSSSSSRPAAPAAAAAAARARARAAAASAKAAEAPARIALGATFGAPVFNLLVGLPLPAAIAALRAGWSGDSQEGGGGGGGGSESKSARGRRRLPLPARLTNGALALGSASIVALALLSVVLPSSRLCRWRVGRSVAAGAAAFWVAALAVFALVEVGGLGGEAVPSARGSR